VMVSKIHKELGVELPLKEFFKMPTIAGLSQYIVGASERTYTAITPVEAKEYYETSYTQKRMWLINQLNPTSPMFNMPGRVTLYEEVDEAIVQEVFGQLIERHEALRTRFETRSEELETGSLVQIIDKGSEFIIDKIDLLGLSLEEREQERMRIYERIAVKIFNLKEGRLIDVKLIKVGEREYDLVFCLHHIISDGWSMDVLQKEFFILYEAYKYQRNDELDPLRIQYKDFAEWQNRVIENKELSESAKSFWMNQLSGEIPTLSLPTDYRINDADDKRGSAYKVVLAEDIMNKLRELAVQSHTSLFMVLITTFITFLSELTEEEDILVGIPTFGRNHEELLGVIGCFVNTTILRNRVNKTEKFIEVLKSIDENVLDALEYQDYPLELVIEELNIKYPQISAFFNMLNFNESATDTLANLDFEHLAETQDVKFDLEWYVTEYSNAVQIMCVYHAGLFHPETIEYIMSKYIDYVTKLSENPEKSLKDYFTTEKKRRF